MSWGRGHTQHVCIKRRMIFRWKPRLTWCVYACVCRFCVWMNKVMCEVREHSMDNVHTQTKSEAKERKNACLLKKVENRLIGLLRYLITDFWHQVKLIDCSFFSFFVRRSFCSWYTHNQWGRHWDHWRFVAKLAETAHEGSSRWWRRSTISGCVCTNNILSQHSVRYQKLMRWQNNVISTYNSCGSSIFALFFNL